MESNFQVKNKNYFSSALLGISCRRILMPKTIEVSPQPAATTSTTVHNNISRSQRVGGGDEVQNLMSSPVTAEQRRQKFLFISRRTTTTVFANHDQSAANDDGQRPKQVRRQISCQNYGPMSTCSSILSPMETHFEWNDSQEPQRSSGVLLCRSQDDILDTGARLATASGSNKIRLKIVW